MSENLDIRSYQEGDEKHILELFRHTFGGRQLSAKYWLWRFQNNPYGPAFIKLAWDKDTLAAHYAVTRLIMRIGGQDKRVGLTGTVMTDRAYQGRGFLSILGKRVYSEMADQGMEMVWGFPNSSSHRIFVRDLSWQDIYEIPMFRLHLGASQRVDAGESDGVTEESKIDERFDRLWERVSSDYDMIVRRDQSYLTWRLSKPLQQYRVIVRADKEEIRGYMVFKRYAEELQVVDMLIGRKDADTGRALIAYVIRQGQKEKAKTISMWLNVAHPFHHALESMGFKPEGPVTYLAGLALNPKLNASTYDHRRWFFTMSDSDVF